MGSNKLLFTNMIRGIPGLKKVEDPCSKVKMLCRYYIYHVHHLNLTCKLVRFAYKLQMQSKCAHA